LTKILRIYIFEGFRETVIESQVFSWAIALQDIGLSTIGISLTNRKLKTDNRLGEISQKYSIPVSSYQYSNYPLIREIQCLSAIAKVIRKHKKEYEKIVIQTRMPGLIKIAQASRWLLGIKFIFDLRSSPLTEFLYANPSGKGITYRYRIHAFRKTEQQIVHNSDAVFCVSNVLKKYLLTHYGGRYQDSEKITIVPGAANHKYFFFSKELREEIRHKLSCSEKTVFIYSGRLNKQWQVPDKVFELFAAIHHNLNNSFFIILTPDIEIARKHLEMKGIPESAAYIEYKELTQINPYLNAADYAIVLRENLPINHHASPTKISEYLVTGLSVIITHNLGDYSTFIEEQQMGCVVDIDNPEYTEDVLAYLRKEMNQPEEYAMSRSKRAISAVHNYAMEQHILNIYNKFITI